MPGPGLADAIEVIPDRLHWAAMRSTPKSTSELHYFSIDKTLVYKPFYADFGPLNLSVVVRYCKKLEAMLGDPALANQGIVHCCSHDPQKRANAACLICAYQVIVLHKTAEMAYEPFRGINPPFLPFRDATCGIGTFHLTIVDCLKGLEESIKNGWFDWRRFDDETYDFFNHSLNGNMTWIIPEELLAFAAPNNMPEDADGVQTMTPEKCADVFQESAIRAVIRLNKVQYDGQRFIDHGIKHDDLYIPVAGCPSRDDISKFFHIVDAAQGAVAVHCQSGLGRAGTLIGLYAMARYRMPARAFIGWCRICRPGSILGRQQQFLVDMQNAMLQLGAARRGPPSVPRPWDSRDALARQMEAEQLSGRSPAEREDVGRDERLCNTGEEELPHPGSSTDKGSATNATCTPEVH